ncbi:hypothetical protein VTK56DRAFT_1218 [Thermocarpiscus australiensis]
MVLQLVRLTKVRYLPRYRTCKLLGASLQSSQLGECWCLVRHNLKLTFVPRSLQKPRMLSDSQPKRRVFGSRSIGPTTRATDIHILAGTTKHRPRRLASHNGGLRRSESAEMVTEAKESRTTSCHQPNTSTTRIRHSYRRNPAHPAGMVTLDCPPPLHSCMPPDRSRRASIGPPAT